MRTPSLFPAVAIAVAVVAVTAACPPHFDGEPATGADAPARVMSGMTGAFFSEDGRYPHLERMIDLLGTNGFNSIDVKFQETLRSCDVAPRAAEIRALVDRARRNGLAFNVYLYPVPYNGRRYPEWPEHTGLPCVVDADGNEAPAVFLMWEPAVWRQIFHHALRFAELQREIGFASLRFDVETLPLQTSYDDATWGRFCDANPDFSASTPPAGRFAALEARNAGNRYEKFFGDLVEAGIASFVKDLRARSPKIQLGYMPADHHALSPFLDRTLAADDVPAWLDSWDMYNGCGYVPSIKMRAEAARKIHPMNRFVSWIRPNTYRPEDVAAAVYHAAANSDGYSIWSLYMLDEAERPHRVFYHELPENASESEYVAAFRKANAALRADMAEGCPASASRIPASSPRPLVAPLSWDDIVFPDLLPAGDGTGEDRTVMFRSDPHTMYIYAKAGQDVRATIRHEAGNRRPMTLQYVVVDSRGEVLRNESVLAGQEETFSLSAPRTGLYVLRVTGGPAAQAWFSVKVHAPLHWAVDASSGVGMFEPHTRAPDFYVPGRELGNGKLSVSVPQGVNYDIVIGNEAPRAVVSCMDASFDLPQERVVRVAVTRHKSMSWGPTFHMTFPDGATPLVFPVRERRLEPISGKIPINARRNEL